MSSTAASRRARFGPVGLVALCAAFAIIELTLVETTRVLAFFALGSIPIVVSGWVYAARGAVPAAAGLYGMGTLYAMAFRPDLLWSRSSAMGLVTHTIFAAVGIAVGRMRIMSQRIQQLNRELVTKNEELTELTLRDHLTDLHNRRYVSEVVYEMAKNHLSRLTVPEAQLRDINVVGKVIAVFMVDLDRFKEINDVHGHGIGDDILIAVSQRLRAAVRFDDIVARWGGEEFLVVCPATGRSGVSLIAEKILQCVRSEAIVLDQAQVQIHASVGCACFPFSDCDPTLLSFEEVINLADAALYRAKRNGRNQASIAMPGEPAAVERLKTRTEPLRRLIADPSLFRLETIE